MIMIFDSKRSREVIDFGSYDIFQVEILDDFDSIQQQFVRVHKFTKKKKIKMKMRS